MQFSTFTFALLSLAAFVAAAPTPENDQMRGYLVPRSPMPENPHVAAEYARNLLQRRGCTAYPCEDADDCAQYAGCHSCTLQGNVRRCEGDGDAGVNSQKPGVTSQKAGGAKPAAKKPAANKKPVVAGKKRTKTSI